MAWVYLDDQFPDHPKVALAGGDAAWLFVCGLAYIKRYATRGVIPKGQVPKLSDRKAPAKLARRLVDVGLWVDDGDHYRVHDYDEWNKPQESRSAAGRKAAQARWAKDAKRNANAPADASEPHSETDSDPPYDDDAYPDASECPPPHPYPTDVLTPPVPLQTAVDNSAGEGSLIDQAITLAASRYVQHQQDRGKVPSPSGLVRWWLQENEHGARHRAERLLADHDLTATQLADALASATDPSWLNAYRRRETPHEISDEDRAKVASIMDGVRARIERPGATA